jgi:hypothetical protein
MRLSDLEPHESLSIRCACGRCVEYPNKSAARHLRLPEATPLADLPGRLRCRACGSRHGLTVSILDRRASPKPGEGHPERIIGDRT